MLKKHGFTMIELLIVITIVAILSALLTPKIQYTMYRAKKNGVQKNEELLGSLSNLEHSKIASRKSTTKETATSIYESLSKNTDINNMINPLNKKSKGIGYIDGNVYDNTNKAAYIFTEEPILESLPDGVVYITITPDNEIVSGQGVENKNSNIILFTDASIGQNSVLLSNKTNIYATGSYRHNKLIKDKNLLTFENVLDTSGIKQAKVATNDIFILEQDNDLIYYGEDGYGESGTSKGGTETAQITLRNEIVPFNDISSFKIGKNILAILDSSNSLWTVGENKVGQLGLGDTINKQVLTKVNITDIKDVGVGYDHIAVLKNDGTVWTSGMNSEYQLGLGDAVNRSTLSKVPLPSTIKEMSVCNKTTAALTNSEDAYVFGKFLKSQDVLAPIKINTEPIVRVIAGDRYVIMQTKTDRYYYIGYNEIGALGNGTKGVNITTPTELSIPNIRNIFTGTSGILIVQKNGDTYTAGTNTTYGMLGLGDTLERLTYTKIENVKYIGN